MDAISTLTASGMQARMQSLEMLANNLANVETSGFKADREFYSLYISADASQDPVTGHAQTQPLIEAPWIDLAQGNLRSTSNPLDFAIDGNGMFAINTGAGIRYTRNGSFRISATGILTTSEGNPVRARGGGQIAVVSNAPIEVLQDGTVQQSGQQLGQLELAAFDRDGVDKMGASYFAPFAGVVAKPATGAVMQGKLEQSNVVTAESAVRLVAIMRQFEMLQKAMNIGNELNRHAIEEVARVAT
jgi:flagellar basal body rod protein FlgG